jgi:8-oxo-dGTP pyrophosphatase MutT (NUDIX family)
VNQTSLRSTLLHEGAEVLQIGRRVIAARVGKQPTTGGVGILLDDQGRVLMTLARYRRGWHFPGGWCRPDEDPADGIQRELAEEVNYHAGPGALTIAHRSKHRHHTEHFAVADVEAHVAATLRKTSWELREVRWITPRTLPMKLHPFTRSLLTNGEGVLDQADDRFVWGPAARAALDCAQ